jgi:hypothetical protein
MRRGAHVARRSRIDPQISPVDRGSCSRRVLSSAVRKTTKKLILSLETIRLLQDKQLGAVAGGVPMSQSRCESCEKSCSNCRP